MKTKAFFLCCLFATAVLSAQPKLNPNNIPEIVKAMSPQEKALLVFEGHFMRNYLHAPKG